MDAKSLQYGGATNAEELNAEHCALCDFSSYCYLPCYTVLDEITFEEGSGYEGTFRY